MALYIFRKYVAERGHADDYVLSSAATSTEELGNPVYPPARRELARHGIDASGHAAHQMTKREYEEFDMIVAMDGWNVRNLMRMTGGDPLGKVRLMLAGSPNPRDIADPWYTGDFKTTYDDIYEGCTLLYEETQGKLRAH